MFSKLAQHIEIHFQRRRATEALGRAMKKGDLEAMEVALAGGPHLDRIQYTYDEPMMHFQETYDIKGSLEVAVEERLPLKAFEMLLRAGARPLNPNEPLFNSEQMRRPDARAILDMVDRVYVQSQALEAGTQQATNTIRRPRF